MLVVIANRGTLAEPRWVRAEVEAFRAQDARRPVIPISIGGALGDPALAAASHDWLQFADRIWIDDTQAACDEGVVSEAALERLATAPTAVRARKRWRWTMRFRGPGLNRATSWRVAASDLTPSLSRPACPLQSGSRLHGGSMAMPSV